MRAGCDGSGRNLPKSEAAPKLRGGEEGGVGLFEGPPFQGAETEQADDVPRRGRGLSRIAPESDFVGGRKGADHVGERLVVLRPPVPMEVAVVRSLDPRNGAEKWDYGRVWRWCNSRRKAPTAVEGVNIQLLAEAPSIPENSTRSWGWT